MFLETLALDSLDLSALLAVLAGFLLIALVIGIVFYVYFSLAIQSIAKKMKYENSWFAWIPGLNIAMILQLGGFHWAWVFLILGTIIPIAGAFAGLALCVLMIISFWKIFEKQSYPGALSLLLLVPLARVITIGIVAWNKKK